MANRKKYPTLYIFCRMVGPGGTTVDFYPQKDGDIKVIWRNENIPYGEYDEETYEAKDGHNVDTITAEAWNRVSKGE